METFKLWILSVSGATLIATLLKVLLSNSSLKKSINVFLSVFVLLYTVLPISNLDINIKDAKTNNVEDFNEFYKQGYISIITESIKNVCEENNVTVIKVNVDSYIDEDGILCVNELFVDIKETGKEEQISELINDQLGYEVSVS